MSQYRGGGVRTRHRECERVVDHSVEVWGVDIDVWVGLGGVHVEGRVDWEEIDSLRGEWGW